MSVQDNNPFAIVLFCCCRLAVTMRQRNVSNGFRIEGDGFELRENQVVQAGSCLGGVSDSSPYEPSVALYV